MATEKQIQEGVQNALLEITDYFGVGDVTINDQSFLDAPSHNNNYIAILNSDDVAADQGNISQRGSFRMPLFLACPYFRQTESENNFRDVRQAIVNKFNGVGKAVTAGGLEGIQAKRIDTDPKAYITADDDPEAVSVMIIQTLYLVFEHF